MDSRVMSAAIPFLGLELREKSECGEDFGLVPGDFLPASVVDVPARDYDCARRLRAQLPVQYRSRCARASAFHPHLQLLREPGDRARDFILGERHDVVESVRADVQRVGVDLTRQAIGERGDARDCYHALGFERSDALHFTIFQSA